MKLPLLVLAVVTLGTGICDLCQPAEARAAAALPAPSSAANDTVVLHIEGMDCGGCTIATRKVLERLDGVTKADVSYEQKRAVVTFDPQKVTTQQMIAAVAMLKYTATVVRAGAPSSAKPSGPA
jgi:mercuric transport protein